MNAPARFVDPSAELKAEIRSAQDARTFVLAGNAILTLTSKLTLVRYTFRVRKIEDAEGKFFVSYLTGPSNEASYSYMGLLIHDDAGFRFRLTAKSKVTDESAPVKAFRFFVGHVLTRNELPELLAVHHEGRCGRCGRLLTVPESIERGIGPDCWEMMGGAS